MAITDDSLILGLTEQTERITGLGIPVSHSGFSDDEKTKYILSEVLSPLISELDAHTGAINKSTDLLRVNDGAGNETKVPVEEINPDIVDLDTSNTLSDGDYITFYDSTESGDRKTIIQNFVSEIKDITGWSTSVREPITESYILSTIQTTYLSKDLDVGATTHAIMHITKIGRQVVGCITNLVSTSDNYYTVDGGDFASGLLPSDVRPVNDGSGEAFVFNTYPDSPVAVLEIYADGTIKLKIHASTDKRIGFAYVSAS